MTGIPDDVIEAMARAYASKDGVRLGEHPDFPDWHWEEYIELVVAALRAAEAVNYKLIGREPTQAMIRHTQLGVQNCYELWDAAPGVDKP